MQRRIKRRRVWIFILMGVLVLVLLSGCNGLITDPEFQRLRLEISQLREQIAELQTQVTDFRAENQILKEKLKAAGVVLLKEGEIVLNETFRLWNSWKITIISYNLVDRIIRFDFLVENLQDEPAFFNFANFSGAYLMDNEGSKYLADISIKGGNRTLIKDMPLEGYLTFSDLKEEIKSVAFFVNQIYAEVEGKGKVGEIHFGPIELK